MNRPGGPRGMFEGLTSIDWSKLSHSHGPADEVPFHLTNLIDSDEEAQEEAIKYFWEYMRHQGTAAEATSHVVPFLFEALTKVEQPVQKQLIDLLLGLAVGLGESFLPNGYDLEVEEWRYQEKSRRGLYPFGEARAAYYEVHQRADRFTVFLQPQFAAETRLSAGFAVAHFAQPLSTFHRQLAGYIDAESDLVQLQNMLLCFGMLGRFADPQPDTDILLPFLNKSCTRPLRVAAAIALTTMLGPRTPDLAVQTLLTALTKAWPLTSLRDDDLKWNEGDLLGYAALVLPLIGQEGRDEIARALCEALKKTEACTFAIPQTLLDILFVEPKPASGWKVAKFDNVQRTSMNVLLRTNHWKEWMIFSRFLPSGLTGDKREYALKQFFREVTGEDYQGDLSKHSGNVSSWNFKKYWPQP